MGHVYVDGLDEVLRRGLGRQLAHLELELAAVAHAHGVAVHVDGQFYEHLAAGHQAEEVHVVDLVGEGIELDGLDDGLVGLAVDLQVDRVEGGAVHQFLEGRDGGGEMEVLALAVQDAGNALLATELAGAFLAEFGALLAFDDQGFHGTRGIWNGPPANAGARGVIQMNRLLMDRCSCVCRMARAKILATETTLILGDRFCSGMVSVTISSVSPDCSMRS
jgi:hypothetical protein